MHNISATTIHSWPRPISVRDVAHAALEAANAGLSPPSSAASNQSTSPTGTAAGGSVAGAGRGNNGPASHVKNLSSLSGQSYATTVSPGALGFAINTSASTASAASTTIPRNGSEPQFPAVPVVPSAATFVNSGGLHRSPPLSGGSASSPTHPHANVPSTPVGFGRTASAASNFWTSASQGAATTSSFTSPAATSYDQVGFDVHAPIYNTTAEAAAAAGLAEDEYKRGLAHFESALKDNDLADDRHQRRLMELLVPAGVFHSDHEVPRFVHGGSAPHAVIFQDGTSRSSMHFTGNPMMGPGGLASLAALAAHGGAGGGGGGKVPLRWNWTVLKLSSTQYLATFITQTCFEEYQSLGFAVHLDCDSYETALRQARWVVAAGAIRLLVAAPSETGTDGVAAGLSSPSAVKIHSEFVEQVTSDSWRRLEKQRWLHFLTALKRYTLPRPEVYLHVAATVVPAAQELPTSGMTRAQVDLTRALVEQQQQQQQQATLQQQSSQITNDSLSLAAVGQRSTQPMDENGDADASSNLLQLRACDYDSPASAPLSGSSPRANAAAIANAAAAAAAAADTASIAETAPFNPYRILFVPPTVFPPQMTVPMIAGISAQAMMSFMQQQQQQSGGQQHQQPLLGLRALPPARYILGFKEQIADVLLKAYMVQIAAGPHGGAPTPVWQAWHNFFHAALFSLVPTLEDEAPLSVWHFAPLVDGLVPGTFFSGAPKSKKTTWDVALRVYRFLAEKNREELGLFRPAAGMSSGTNSSIEESPTLMLLFQAMVPLMRLEEERGGSSGADAASSSTASGVSSASPSSGATSSAPSGLPSSVTASSGWSREVSAGMTPDKPTSVSMSTIGSPSASPFGSGATTAAALSAVNSHASGGGAHHNAAGDGSGGGANSEWTEPSALVNETLNNWRCYVQRCVAELEWRVSRVFFCSARIHGQLQQQQQQRNAAATGLAPRLLAGQGVGDSTAGGGAAFVRCTCDRCQEDTELILRADPFVLRLIHPIAKQLTRLLKRLTPSNSSKMVI